MYFYVFMFNTYNSFIKVCFTLFKVLIYQGKGKGKVTESSGNQSNQGNQGYPGGGAPGPGDQPNTYNHGQTNDDETKEDDVIDKDNYKWTDEYYYDPVKDVMVKKKNYQD